MKRDNYILAGILSAITVVFFILTLKLPDKARTYPLFILGLLTFLIIVFLIDTNIRAKKESGKSEPLFKDFQKKQFTIVFSSAATYVILMDVLGYFTSTMIYIVFCLVALKVKRSKSMLITLGFSAFIYLVFVYLLKVPLPKGFLV